MFLPPDNEDSNRTARKIYVLVGHTCQKVRFPSYRNTFTPYHTCSMFYYVLKCLMANRVDPDHITKTCLYNFDPLKLFDIVKLGFTGVYVILLISAQKHRLWVLVRTASFWRF